MSQEWHLRILLWPALADVGRQWPALGNVYILPTRTVILLLDGLDGTRVITVDHLGSPIQSTARPIRCVYAVVDACGVANQTW